jgi:predicted RNase H-like nuclease (RuvC/YqgF family)
MPPPNPTTPSHQQIGDLNETVQRHNARLEECSLCIDKLGTVFVQLAQALEDKCQAERITRSKKMMELANSMSFNFERAEGETSKLEAQLEGCQIQNVQLAQQVADLTNVVMQLRDRMGMMETRVKTDEGE